MSENTQQPQDTDSKLFEKEKFNETMKAARMLHKLHSSGMIDKSILSVYELLSNEQRKDIILGFLEGFELQKISDEEAKKTHPSIVAELETMRLEDRKSLRKLQEWFTKTITVVLGLVIIISASGYFFLGGAIDKVSWVNDDTLRFIAELFGMAK